MNECYTTKTENDCIGDSSDKLNGINILNNDQNKIFNMEEKNILVKEEIEEDIVKEEIEEDIVKEEPFLMSDNYEQNLESIIKKSKCKIKRKKKKNNLTGKEELSSLDHKITAQEDKRLANRHKRPCKYCNKYLRYLPSHYNQVHQNEPEIVELGKLSGEARRNKIRLLRSEGIAKENERRMNSGSTNLIYQRIQNKDLAKMVTCTRCKGVLSKATFHRHKRCCPATHKIAQRNEGFLPIVKATNSQLEQRFQTNILKVLRLDSIGKMILKDQNLYDLGLEYYYEENGCCKNQHSFKKRICAHMRSLTRVHIKMNKMLKKREEKEISVFDIFQKKYVRTLHKVIKNISYEGNNFKYGSYFQCGYAVKTAAKSLVNIYHNRDNPLKQKEVSDFLKHYNNKWAKNFKQAEINAIRSKNQVSLLPEHEDLEKLHAFLDNNLNINVGNSELTPEKFIQLRKICFCKIVYFNSRPPTEVASLTIEEWVRAKNNDYASSFYVNFTQAEHENIINTFKICNRSKNEEDVPVIFPLNTWAALEILASANIRRSCGVNEDNDYLFPALEYSSNSIESFDEVNYCCEKAGLTKRIPCVDNRHILATMLGQLKMSTKSKETILRHFGHSETERETEMMDDNNEQTEERANYSDAIHLPCRGNSEEEEDDDGDASSEDEIEQFPKGKKTPYSREEKQSIAEYFRDFITGRRDSLEGATRIPGFLSTYPFFLSNIKLTPREKKEKLRGQVYYLRKLYIKKQKNKLSSSLLKEISHIFK